MRQIALSVIFAATACSVAYPQAPQKGSFGHDLDFLRKHKEVVVLKSQGDRCQVAIIPADQGRVMTSTADGSAGKSYGWINHDLISNGEFVEHINVFSQQGGARDPNLLLHDGVYYMSYCSQRSVLTRTSRDLVNWSEPTAIYTADSFEPESPSLIHCNDTFYLFVCSWDGNWDRKEVQGAYQHKTYVYQSDDLLDFGIGNQKEITTLNSHAPEIFPDEDGQWYISSVEWPNRGVSVDKLHWE